MERAGDAKAPARLDRSSQLAFRRLLFKRDSSSLHPHPFRTHAISIHYYYIEIPFVLKKATI